MRTHKRKTVLKQDPKTTEQHLQSTEIVDCYEDDICDFGDCPLCLPCTGMITKRALLTSILHNYL